MNKKVQNSGISGAHDIAPWYDAAKHKQLADVNETLKAPNLSKKDFLGAANMQLAMMYFAPNDMGENAYMVLSRNLMIAAEGIRNMKPSRKAWDKVCNILNAWKRFYHKWDFRAQPNLILPDDLTVEFEWIYAYFEKHMLNLQQVLFAKAIVEVDCKLESIDAVKNSPINKEARAVLAAAMCIAATTTRK